MKYNLTSIAYIILMLIAILYCKFLSGQNDSTFLFTTQYEGIIDSSIINPTELTQSLSYSTNYWGENNEGNTPTEAIYIQSLDRVYLYGFHGITVYDASSLTYETFIPICNYGQYNKATAVRTFQGNKMAYDDGNLLYCFTYDFHIKIINLQTNQIIDSCLLDEFNIDDAIGRTILKFDKSKTYLFLVVNKLSLHSKCYRFNINSFHNYFYEWFPQTFYDFEISETKTNIFASLKDEVSYKFSVLTYSFYPLTGIPSFESDTRYRHIEYIYDPDDNIHKAFCFPAFQGANNSFTALIYDGDSYGQNYLDLYPWQLDINSTKYMSDEHLIYFGYNDQSSDGVGKLNVIDNSISDINLGVFIDEYINDILVTGSKIILGREDRIQIIDNSYPYLNWSSIEYPGDLILSLTASSSNIFASNYQKCSLEILDINGNFMSSNLTGGSSLDGIYSSSQNKVYMYNPSHSGNLQRIFSKNLTSQQNSTIDFTDLGFGYISSLATNDDGNYIYASICSNQFQTDGEIIKIDASNNSIIDGFSLPQNSLCRKLFYANNKLYCLIETFLNQQNRQIKIFIVDLSDPSNTYLLSPNTIIFNDQSYGNFIQDESGDLFLAISIYNDPNEGIILKIENETNTIVDIFNAYFPRSIAYDKYNSKLYFTNNELNPYLGVIDLETSTVHYENLTSSFTRLIEPIYDEFKNEVCLFGHIETNDPYNLFDTRFTWMDPVSFEISNSLTIDPLAISINWNSNNGNIYAFYPRSDNNMQALGIIKRNAYENEMLQLSDGQRIIGSTAYTANKIFFDNSYSHLFVPNNFFSDFYQVDLNDEQLNLRPKITWLSFPKLEREGNDPVDAVQVLTGRITPDNFNYGKMSHNEVIPNPAGPPHDQTMTYIEKVDPELPWNPQPGLLQNVQSTKGYILEIVPESPGTIDLYGSRLDPSTTFPLYTGVDNWTGYFLTYPQDVFDAFEPILDYVYSVKTQDWAIVRQHPPGGGGGGPDDFLQPSHPLVLEYGDLAIVEVMQDIPEFTWNNLAPANQGSEVPMAETFSYEELSAYTPIYMQLDTAENPAEIGAFVNDSCVGACVVNTYDTLAALRAYTGELTGEITFQQYYGPTKSSNRKIDSYLVYEPGLDAMVNRTIHTGEGKDFYLVSLKTGNSPVAGYSNGISLQVLPNPCSGPCSLRYAIPYTCDVAIEVFNATGIRLNSFNYGQQPAGQYDFSIPGPCRPGVYIIKLSACGSSKVKKLVITH